MRYGGVRGSRLYNVLSLPHSLIYLIHLRIGEWQTSIYTCLNVKIVGTSFRSGYVGKTNNKDHFTHNFSI